VRNLVRAFSEVKEDYLSTRQAAVDNQIGDLELFIAFGRQLTIRFWDVTLFRVITGALAVTIFQLPTFIHSATLFGLVSFYLPLPFSTLSILILGARLFLTLLLVIDVSRPAFLEMEMYQGEISTASIIPVAIAVSSGILCFLVIVIAEFVRNTKQTMPETLANLSFYLIVLSSFLTSLWTEDQQILGWLSFGVLVSVSSKIMLVGAITVPTPTSID